MQSMAHIFLPKMFNADKQGESMEKNVIAILGGFESDETYTERALVLDDLDIIFEKHTDSTVKLPSTHSCWLDWMNEEE